jgi:uncharacterized protein YxjI
MIYMNCSYCGVEIKNQNQKYCEECGHKLSSSSETTEYITPDNVAFPTPQTSVKTGGLFDINRNYYVLKEGYWDWGSGDILDDSGNIIGTMRREIFSIRKRIDLLELNGTVAASIHEKIITARGAQDLKDPQGNLIARIKKKILTFLHPKFYLEDPLGNRWFEAVGNFMGWSFQVSDLSTGKIVAEIDKADRWRDVFLGGLFDFKDTYALNILDNTTDRRILLGFVLSIDNVLHDQHGTGMAMGRYGRGFPGRSPGRRPF